VKLNSHLIDCKPPVQGWHALAYLSGYEVGHEFVTHRATRGALTRSQDMNGGVPGEGSV